MEKNDFGARDLTNEQKREEGFKKQRLNIHIKNDLKELRKFVNAKLWGELISSDELERIAGHIGLALEIAKAEAEDPDWSNLSKGSK
jgi:hypothetical protein